jgi:hypothetical protein
MILQPTKEDFGYVWNDLEIKQSEEAGAGDGVFAARLLPVGTMIPILGKKVDLDLHNFTHGWVYRNKQAVDGNPSIKPYKGVGNNGLSIAMMINEPTKRKINCIFKLDHVVVAKPIKQGNELTIDYGREYEPTRESKGYTLDNNKYRDAVYKSFDKLKFPTFKVRDANITHWNNIIDSSSKPEPTKPDQPDAPAEPDEPAAEPAKPTKQRIQPSRNGARNTYHCSNKGTRVCPNICPQFWIAPDNKLYCSYCLPEHYKHESKSISVGDWQKFLDKDNSINII